MANRNEVPLAESTACDPYSIGEIRLFDSAGNVVRVLEAQPLRPDGLPTPLIDIAYPAWTVEACMRHNQMWADVMNLGSDGSWGVGSVDGIRFVKTRTWITNDFDIFRQYRPRPDQRDDELTIEVF